MSSSHGSGEAENRRQGRQEGAVARGRSGDVVQYCVGSVHFPTKSLSMHGKIAEVSIIRFDPSPPHFVACLSMCDN